MPPIQFLADVSPESVRQVHRDGYTVLHKYIKDGKRSDISVVKCLVNLYPDALKMRDKISGMTPLAVACEEQRTAYVMEANSDVDAIRFMAPLCKELLESEDGIETPLHSVCSKLAAWSRSSVSRIPTL